MRGRPQFRTSGRCPSSSRRSRAPSLRRSFVAVAVALSVALASPTAVPQPAEAADLLFRRPTPAPVLDPFRLNDGEYGPGNRGNRIRHGRA